MVRGRTYLRFEGVDWLDCRGCGYVTSVVAVNRLPRHKTASSPRAGPSIFFQGAIVSAPLLIAITLMSEFAMNSVHAADWMFLRQ